MSTTAVAARDATTAAARATVRTLSFGRARKQTATHRGGPRDGNSTIPRELSLFKAGDEPIGLSLVKPVIEGLTPNGEGVAMVSAVAAGSAAARSKKIKAGDLLCAVNGVRVRDFKHASDMIREAKGVIQCVIISPNGLPDGWEAHTDKKGVQFFRNAALNVKSYHHPAALTIVGPEQSPKKQRSSGDPTVSAVSRWHTAFHTVSLINSLAGETEREVRDSDGEEAGGVRVTTLQRERV